MSYSTIYQSSGDAALQGRITACAAQEGAEDPPAAMYELMWPVVTATDIAAAYESAVLNNNPDPGGDPTVITDQMILSTVQANLPAP